MWNSSPGAVRHLNALTLGGDERCFGLPQCSLKSASASKSMATCRPSSDRQHFASAERSAFAR